ncbi:uncharacterized protein LOC116294125 [Actinia tenebrosa]|uniref:Uncharacterized protein LOC116294125 n=1 Tax=Actinia tenebrosa TaxID=6105 RepID=A0A6P8HR08_ACTTE|nr:uncharacterized protein LOC116294125 [Actinia tenebrosa]
MKTRAVNLDIPHRELLPLKVNKCKQKEYESNITHLLHYCVILTLVAWKRGNGNFCWHLDGYDKLKPFGFSIHGGIDGFSQKILWLEVQRSNKNPKVIAKYFLGYIEVAKGCPARVYNDLGTENGLVAGIQCYLRADGFDQYSGTNAHKYVPSTSNQRIECFWSSYRKQRSSWWIDFFNDLYESDILDLASEIHREALWFCFSDLLQSDLDKVKEYWNSHRIRKSKHATFSGVPDVVYFLPEDYGQTDCLQ